MSREVDRRDFNINKVTAARRVELSSLAADVSDHLPGGHRIRITGYDPLTGNPARIESESAPAEKGNYIQRALAHVQGIRPVLSVESTQAPEFTADPNPQTTSSGSVIVHLQQNYKGIPIFQAAEAVRFAPDGALAETAGSSISILTDKSTAPAISVQEAVLKAAQHVAVPDSDEQGETDPFGEPLPTGSVDLTGFQPKVIASFPEQPEKTTVLEAGPFGDEIKASLIWFPIEDDLHLSWEVILTMPQYQGQYRTIVDSIDGEIQYCRQLIHSLIGRGNVYTVDGSQPRRMVEFPRLWGDYGLPVPEDLPGAAPDFWIDEDRATGNSVFAHLGDAGPSIQGRVENEAVIFNPADATGDDQKVLNIFYYNCVMHDYFYLLGFRERDGNFQQRNFERGGVQSDRVDARAHSGAVWGTANMATPIDGSSPIMNMGLVTSTNRHTAFDSSVVFHEFMHGVTNRLVGGPMNTRALDAPQSGGMGEGWGDYVACTINQNNVVGAWVVNRAGGIRGFPYDSNFPDHFGSLGKGRYTGVHAIGEIWCATLMEMTRNIGSGLAVQLVVDALKLAPANPSFLEMRDSILLALDNKRTAGQLGAGEYTNARQGIWAAFVKFGMGPEARSNGASLAGIVPDFNLPSDEQPNLLRVQAGPNLPIPDKQPAGVSSVIEVVEAGRIKSMQVSIEIEHPYIGDLLVSLVPPDNTALVLHNRQGAGADNLAKTYSTTDTASLSGLVGQPVQGNWRMQVADLARRDVGTFCSWGMDIEVEPLPEIIQKQVAPGLAIPDNDPAGIASPIAIDQDGDALEIKVGLDITHTFIGDLRVELFAPSGEQAILHNRAGGSRDNLIAGYDSTTTPSLALLKGRPVRGNWTLRVTDSAGRDVGKLNEWSLELAI